MIKTNKARTLASGLVIWFMQQLTGILYYIYLQLTGGYTIHVHIPHQLNHSQRYIIAANHQSKLDPFAIFTVLGFRRRLYLLPIKFMTIPWVYHHPLLKPLLYALGCFPAHNKQRPYHTYGVEGSIKLLRYGYNICIFPEGIRTLRENSHPKPGVSRILAEYPEAKLLLAHIDWRVKSFWRRHVTITIIMAPDSLNKNDPQAIMDAIYAL